jgi:DNA-binding HxlR family transcriptional regulator
MSDDFDYGIIREMFLGSTKYSQFQKYMPNISPTLLKNRLRSLEDHGVIMRKKTATQGRYDYYLTPSGKALGPLLTEFGKWGMRFANSGMTEKENTVYGLMRDLSGALDTGELPDCDITVQFNFTDNPESTKQFINIHSGQVEVCSQNLGFEVIEDEKMAIVGNSQYIRNITRWLRISSFTGNNPQFVAPG